MPNAAEFRWLRTGDEAYAVMLTAIRAARRSVRLETYTFAAGLLGESFRDALLEARRRGARVWVLLDAFGSLELGESFWDPLRMEQGEFRWFNPLSFKRFTFRDHRKLLVCDEDVAFIGGFNVAPVYQGDGITHGWRDVGLELHGALAGQLAAAFDSQFGRADLEHPTFTRLRPARSRTTHSTPEGEVLLSSPGRGHNAIKRRLLHDLASAQQVRIAAAYFLPNASLRRALRHVARRGGLVQLVLPGQSDVPLTQSASHSFYRRWLRAGIQVWEYQPQILHSKLVIVDDAVYAGSSNLDPRSLHINYELMVRLTDSQVVAEARQIFADHLAHSRQIRADQWREQRSWGARLKARWACFVLGKLDRLFLRWQLGALPRTPRARWP